MTPCLPGSGGLTAPVVRVARLLLKYSSGPAPFRACAERCGVSHFSLLPASPISLRYGRTIDHRSCPSEARKSEGGPRWSFGSGLPRTLVVQGTHKHTSFLLPGTQITGGRPARRSHGEAHCAEPDEDGCPSSRAATNTNKGDAPLHCASKSGESTTGHCASTSECSSLALRVTGALAF